MVYWSLMWASKPLLMMCDAAAVCCYPVASSSKYYILVSLAITLTGKESIDTLHTLSPPSQGLAQEQAVKEN
jgi:hypothetical protein